MKRQEHPDPATWRDAIERGDSSLAEAATAARGCRACRLWERATQTVFGSGPMRAARLILVGEQPGDREDLAGEPFVGPAGRLLDDALDEAGIDRKTAYLTNVVKHFSFEQRGIRRIHKKPKADEIRACRPWLDAEIALVRPRVVVTLGATASQALLGKQFRVTKDRGKAIASPLAEAIFATVHPSAVLRAPDAAARAQAEQELIADLKTVARHLAEHGPGQQSRRGRSTRTRTETRAAKPSRGRAAQGELPLAARGRR